MEIVRNFQGEGYEVILSVSLDQYWFVEGAGKWQVLDPMRTAQQKEGASNICHGLPGE
jgi:hypothetical protein